MIDRNHNPDLYDLTRHIPSRLIERAPAGKTGSYVPHPVIVQAILATCGPYDWELVEVLRGRLGVMTTNKGKSNEKTWPAVDDVVLGAVWRMTVLVDGRAVTVEEAGSCEAGPWDLNDGERLKKAASDALKRCGMRLGVALHLWCKREDQFFIHRILGGDEPADGGDVLVGVEADDETSPVEPKEEQ